MREPDYEQLTLFQGDSHVSPSPRPGSEEARMMTVTSGRKCSELYGNSGPLGCLVRMCLESSIWHSTRCFLTWKVKDTPARHSLFRLQVSMPRTEETESQFWPTPVNSGGINGGTGAIKTLKALERKGLITESERRQFQQGNGGHTNPALLEWLMGYEQQFTKLIPTPTQTDYKGGITSRYWMPNSQTVQVERESRLAPERELSGPSERISGMHSAWENWPDEPELDRVADGIPNRVERIRCLGNAVVPQQFYPFFLFIAEIESGKENT